MSEQIPARARSGPGRPAFRPTEGQRQMVTVFRATGVAPAAIAHQLGIDEKTLRKHFGPEMAHGKDVIVSRIGGKIVQQALKGNIQAAIFYLKNHGGPEWQDRQRHEFTGRDGAPLQAPDLIVSFIDPPGDDRAP